MADARRTVVVVGASVAGVRCVQALRGKGFDGRIVLLDGETRLPYDKPALSKQVLDGGPAAASPPGLVNEAELAALTVDYRPGSAAIGLDLARRHVLVGDGVPASYTDLVIATGSAPRRMSSLDGFRGVHYLRTLDDALALRGELDGGPRVVVVGGGFIGAEVAAGARARDLPVTIIEAAPRMASRVLPPAAGDRLERLHREHGVRVRCGVGVAGARGGARIESVELADGTSVAADVVVVGIGTLPATGWLAGSGLTLDDGVLCDAYLRAVGADDVWVIGDVARWLNPRYGHVMRTEHWTGAREQAALVGATLAGGPARVCDLVPYVWSDQHGSHIQHVGESPAPGDTVSALPQDGGGGEVFEYRRAGRLVGATGFDAQRAVLGLRRELAATPVATTATSVTSATA